MDFFKKNLLATRARETIQTVLGSTQTRQMTTLVFEIY